MVEMSKAILWSKFTPYVFAVLIAGLICKQLQFGVIGPFEVCTALFCVVVCSAKLCSREPIPYWPLAVAVGLLFAVACAAVFAAVTDPERLNVRDGVAYAFSFLIVSTFILVSQGRELRYVKALALTAALVLFLFLLIAIIPSPVQRHVFYQGTLKLQGLSNNPNQIGFLAVVGLSLLLVLNFSRAIPDWLIILATTACAIAGTMSGSSAYTLAIAATTLLALANMAAACLQRRPIGFPVALVVPVVVVLLSFVPSFVGLPTSRPDVVTNNRGDAFPSNSTDLFDLDADGGQGASRLALWRNAFSVLPQSPIIGLGPGPHVPLTNLVNGSVSLNEAHNTVIDILVVTGVVGLLMLLTIIARIVIHAHRNRQLLILAACLMPLAFYAMLHFLGRQPLFWIVVYLSSSALITILGNISAQVTDGPDAPAPSAVRGV